MKSWRLVLAAIALFFVGDRLGALLLERVLMASPQRFSRMYAGKLDADIVCVGNSRGVYLLDSAEIKSATDQSTANISHNGLTAQMAQALFSDYLEHNQKPRVVMIEASCVTVATAKGIVSEFKPFWGNSQRLQKLGQQYSETVANATKVTRLYQFNSELYLRAVYYLLRGKSDQFGMLSATITQALIDEVERMEPFKMVIQPAELVALHEMIADAKRQGIEVRLVYAPYLPQYAAKMSNLDEFLKDIGEGAGIEPIDLTRTLDADSQFMDRVHMNASGTTALTKMLIERGVFN